MNAHAEALQKIADLNRRGVEARMNVLNELERKFDLQTKLREAVGDEPAMISLSLMLRTRATLDMPTIGVGVNPSTLSYEMNYNPEFMNSLDPVHLRYILHHELYHIMLGHVTDTELFAKAMDRVKNKDYAHGLVNTAMDLAINSIITDHGKHLERLPSEHGCIVGRGKFEKYPYNKTTEEYLDMLLENIPEGGGGDGEGEESESGKIGKSAKIGKGSQKGNPGGGGSSDGEGDEEGEGEGQGSGGDEEGEDEGQGSGGDKEKDEDGDKEGDGKDGKGKPDETKSPWENKSNPGKPRGTHDGFVSSQEMEQAMAQVAEMTLTAMLAQLEQEMRESGKSWGSVSQEVRGKIMERFKTRPVDWRTALQQFVGRCVEGETRTTMTAVNRRLPYLYPGSRTGYTARIGVFVDQSGSMSDYLLGLLFSQLDKLADEIEFVYCPFDAVIFENSVTVWEQGVRPRIIREGCGGTSFEPAVKYAIKQGFEGMIMVTDMYANPPSRAPIPRIWLTDINGKQYNDSDRVAGKGEKVLVVTPANKR